MKTEREFFMSLDPLEIFLKEIRQFPPLNQKQVDTLYQNFILPGRKIEQKKEGQNSLSPEEEKILEKAKEAKEEIFKHNLSLVFFIAIKKAATPTHPLLPDLIQAGNLGLLSAVNKYEPGYGTFANYARWWIFQEIRSERLNQENSFPLSNSHCLKTKRINDYRWYFLNQFGREPTKEEISKGTQLSIITIENAWQLEQVKNAASLDSPVGDEDKSSLEDLLPPNPSQRPVEEAMLENETPHLTIENVLKFPFLTNREAKILALYLAGYKYSQISKKWGLSRERIHQIKDKALKKLRKYLLNRTPVF